MTHRPVQLIQQLLDVNENSKKLVVTLIHSTGCLSLSSVYAGIAKEWAPMDILARSKEQRRTNPFFFTCPYIGSWKKVWTQLKVCLPASRCRWKSCVFLTCDLDYRCALWIVDHSRKSSWQPRIGITVPFLETKRWKDRINFIAHVLTSLYAVAWGLTRMHL